MVTHASLAPGRADRPASTTADARDSGASTVPDTELLARMVAGSEDAFAALYDRHVDVVYRATLRLNSDRSAAAEVVQEAFLTLWNRAEQFDPTRGSLASWLATIARNRAIDHLRRSARQPAMTFSAFERPDRDEAAGSEWLERTGTMLLAAGPEATPEDAFAEQELSRLVARALASIAPAERQVIELAYHAGLSQSEIAARLDWPLGTVKTRTRRALQRLREALEPAMDIGSRDDEAPDRAAPRPPAPAQQAVARGGRSLCPGAS